MVFGGIWDIVDGAGLGFPKFITGVYVILFGAATLLFEFRLPPKVTQYTSFMFSFFGRGMFYIFVGCIVLNPGLPPILAGTIILFVGVAYLFFEFYPVIEAPSNMRKEAYNGNDDSPYIVNPSQHAAANPYSFSGTAGGTGNTGNV